MTVSAAQGMTTTSDPTQSMRVAVLQMTSGTDVTANTAVIVDALAATKASGAAMLFTPEMALLLDRDRSRAQRSVTGGAVEAGIAALQEATAAHGLWLHIGSAPVADPAFAPRWVNRSILIGPDGAIVATYDKLHLFDVQLASGEHWRESNNYAPGGHVTMAETPLGRMGLSICYDLRFSALYDHFGKMGCSAMAIPAAFTVPTGEAHWHVLMRARAIEQGAYVIAAAQVAEHPDGRRTYGHSLVIGPWGDILLDMGGIQSGLGFANIDLEAPARVRAQLPAIEHRRPIPAI